MDIQKIAKEAFGRIEWVLAWVLPRWNKAKIILIKAVGMVEARAKATEKGDEKQKKAIDIFESELVEEGLIPAGIEKALDPIIDWALEWAVDALVRYLNKTFGKDWVKVVAPSKVKNAA